MIKKITLKAVIPTSPKTIYEAWLDSELHSAMTGISTAIVNDEVEKSFAACGVYLQGKNLELIPNRKIVQAWRTTGFKPTDEDSKLEISLEEHADGTLFTLIHRNVPEQEHHVEQGWLLHYFEPMMVFFNK